MVDFHNPTVIERDFLAVEKLWCVLDGILIWELFITLNYEWSVIWGHRPYRWTIWIYSLTRLCALMAVILNMVGFDSSTPIDCQLWAIFELIFAYSAFLCASLLIVLRIIAIWNRNRIVVAIAICTWSSSLAFFIHNIARVQARWAPTLSVCEVLNPEITKVTIIALLIADLVLLITMLVGLLRLRIHGTMFALGKFLWNQGLIWLFLATISEVPAAVFVSLNLNEPFNLMFQTPALIVMTIGATRMHRALAEFANSDCQAFDVHPTRKGRKANPNPKIMFAAPITLSRVEVAFHMSSETADHSPANMGRGSDFQSQDRPPVLNDLQNSVREDEPSSPVAEIALLHG
ncbi:hypothetical protein EI94DRAFT_1836410 [Lactarius quietus]|nr:hypothetical protein EI94DRAFT_1836410 [Lactarius quietus]